MGEQTSHQVHNLVTDTLGSSAIGSDILLVDRVNVVEDRIRIPSVEDPALGFHLLVDRQQRVREKGDGRFLHTGGLACHRPRAGEHTATVPRQLEPVERAVGDVHLVRVVGVGVGLVAAPAGEIHHGEVALGGTGKQVGDQRALGVDVGRVQRLGADHDVLLEGELVGEGRIGFEIGDVDVLLVAVVGVDALGVSAALGQLSRLEGGRNDVVGRHRFQSVVQLLVAQPVDVGGDVVVREVNRRDPAGLRGEHAHRVPGRQRHVGVGRGDRELARPERDAELPQQRVVEVPPEHAVVEADFGGQIDGFGLVPDGRRELDVWHLRREGVKEKRVGRTREVDPAGRL